MTRMYQSFDQNGFLQGTPLKERESELVMTLKMSGSLIFTVGYVHWTVDQSSI